MEGLSWQVVIVVLTVDEELRLDYLAFNRDLGEEEQASDAVCLFAHEVVDILELEEMAARERYGLSAREANYAVL